MCIFHSQDLSYVSLHAEIHIAFQFANVAVHYRVDNLAYVLSSPFARRNSDVYLCFLLQSLFRSFKKLSGMTGTAATEADEFSRIYGLTVVAIPTNKPVDRKDNSDVVFKTKEGIPRLSHFNSVMIWTCCIIFASSLYCNFSKVCSYQKHMILCSICIVALKLCSQQLMPEYLRIWMTHRKSLLKLLQHAWNSWRCNCASNPLEPRRSATWGSLIQFRWKI